MRTGAGDVLRDYVLNQRSSSYRPYRASLLSNTRLTIALEVVTTRRVVTGLYWSPVATPTDQHVSYGVFKRYAPTGWEPFLEVVSEPLMELLGTVRPDRERYYPDGWIRDEVTSEAFEILVRGFNAQPGLARIVSLQDTVWAPPPRRGVREVLA